MNELRGHQKRRQLLQLLDRGLVMLHIDPRADDVVVPAQFADDPVLRLNIAYAFNLPALDVDGSGVFAILSFNRRNFACTLPWPSIFAMTLPREGHEGVVWPECMPAELTRYFGPELTQTGPVPIQPLTDVKTLQAPRPVVPAPDAPPAPDVAALPTADGSPRPLFVVHEGGRGDGPTTGTSARPTLKIVDDGQPGS